MPPEPLPIGSAGDSVPRPPANAAVIFGDGLSLAIQYAELLATAGVQRGLLGPREAPRLWERHLLNCAVVAAAFPIGARVVDVGSGAGLPGLALACARPDLRVDLVDSLGRRTQFLTEAVGALALAARVRVITGRAEDRAVIEQVGGADWVTARAVAPLDRLAGWCLPLLVSGGTLVALKGDQARDEVSRLRPTLRRLGAASVEVVEFGAAIVDQSTRAVMVVRR